MSWIRRELANERYWSEPDWQVDVESSEMREEIGLRYYLDPGDEKLAPEELGRRIDDCLVEYINTSLQRLKGRVISRAGEEDIIIKRDITIEEFESRRRKIDEGMKEDPALQAFEGTEKRGEKLPLASRTYLKLARRHALFGGKRPPSSEEARDFALVLLDHIREAGSWEIDWDRQSVIECLADAWLDSRDPGELEELIQNSFESSLAWDILYSNSQQVVFTGEELPKEHLLWYVEATNGHPKRPDERPAPRHRPKKLGYMIRNNEIRHTVDLLVLVGMKETASRSAVVAAFGKYPSDIGQICRQPSWGIRDLAEHVIERLDPSFYLSPYETWLRLRPCFFRLISKYPLPAAPEE